MTDSGQMICSCADDGVVCAPLRRQPADPAKSADLAAGFKALGDPHRMAILYLLSAAGQPVCVVDVERHIDLAQSTISHHLKVLLDAGVIAREPRGKWSYYSINAARLLALSSELAPLIDQSAGTA